jgi:hypothetical protein
LWQGDTAIRADSIAINQGTGDLLAIGEARSRLTLDSGLSIGQAAQIRYLDGDRIITYDSRLPTAAAAAPAGGRGGRGTALPPAPASRAQLSGVQGDLRAERIEIVLAEMASRADRLEGYGDVTAKVDARTATGSRLTYFASDERYLMTGTGTTQVKVVEKCRAFTGRTLTFFKSTDRIIVDGNEEVRTQTTGGGSCSDNKSR